LAYAYNNGVVLDSLSMDVAGPAVIFLIATIPFYWILIAFIELGVVGWMLSFCKREHANDPNDARTFANELTKDNDV
jgi:hypothetical protein